MEMRLKVAEKDCYFWLTNLTQTIDEQDPENPYKPFPKRDYIKASIPLFLAEKTLFVPKSRSMMASWTLAGLACWLCQTRRATGIVIQSRDEGRAAKLISYIRILYERSDPEWQKLHPLEKPFSAQPKTEARWANDSWCKAITGTSDSIRSEHPTVYIADEAAFMDEFEACLNTSRAARPLHTWAISSAEKGPFFDMIETAIPCDWGGWPAENATGSLDQFLGADVVRPCKGLTFGRTVNGWGVVHMHYSADTTRDAAWVAREKMGYSSAADWEKEQEINPYAKDGAIVYPEFQPLIHVIPHDRIPKMLTRYAAIDPHPRTPHAFLWLGVDQWGDVYVYREMWPSKVYGRAETIKNTDDENRFTIREYVSTLARLEGNKIDWKHPDTNDEYGTFLNPVGSEKIVTRFMDQAGKGFSTGGDMIGAEDYWTRYNRYGLHCYEPKKSHVAGEDAIRELLVPRKHDTYGTWPRLHISSRCPELILELRRFRYPSSARFNPEKELAQKGVESRCHLIDLLRYLATADIVYIPTKASLECHAEFALS